MLVSTVSPRDRAQHSELTVCDQKAVLHQHAWPQPYACLATFKRLELSASALWAGDIPE